MKMLFFVATVFAVMALAFWAYQGNYQTQGSIRAVRSLQNEIASLREAISVQRAEWAYLNRPDRLAELADLNFDRLNLLPLDPGQFADVAAIPYPAPEVPAADTPVAAIINPVDVSGTLAQPASPATDGPPSDGATP